MSVSDIWTYNPRTNEVTDRDGAHVCFARNPEDGAKIAATPELLDCLRLTLLDLERQDITSEAGRLLYIAQNIRAALAKVEGRPNG